MSDRILITAPEGQPCTVKIDVNDLDKALLMTGCLLTSIIQNAGAAQRQAVLTDLCNYAIAQAEAVDMEAASARSN